MTAPVRRSRNGPIEYGPFGAEFRVPIFNADAEKVEPMLMPVQTDAPPIRLTGRAERQLRLGIGRIDMDVRWLAWLDDGDRLRLWRSWTGHEIYRAQFAREDDGLVLQQLVVEGEPSRFKAEREGQAQRFRDTLAHLLSLTGVDGDAVTST